MNATAKATPSSCGSRPTRRTKVEMGAIRAAMHTTLQEIQPATVRQLYYQLVSRGVVGKTETEYKSTVGRLLTEMRRDGTIPYGWVADNTRWMRKPDSYTGLEQMLAETRGTYRRALWASQSVHVEVWLEKDALAGVLYPETAEWDVPLMVTRGYPSLSYLYEASETIRAKRKPVFIYYLGDHDPSGVNIPQVVERDLRSMAPGAEITFERLAVLPEQIISMGLPTRPTKKSDTRSKNFEGESVEVDAIPPAVLRSLVSDRITGHINWQALTRLWAVEEAERGTLDRIIAGLGGAA